MSEKSRYDTEFILDRLFRAKRKLGLNSGQFEVLCALVRHDCPDEKGVRKGEVWCAAGNGLRDLTELSEKNLRRILGQLEEHGAITCLNPETVGRGKPKRWCINYGNMDWEKPPKLSGFNPEKTPQVVPENPPSCPPNLGMESRNEDPPPQSPSPSSQSHPSAQPQTEEEDFPFLSRSERSLLGDLRLSRAGWRMVDDAAPELLTQALQHIESSRTEIEGAGFSGEQRFGAILNGSYVLPKEPEPEPANGNGRKRYFCSFCGSVYGEEEHECTEETEPAGEDLRARGSYSTPAPPA